MNTALANLYSTHSAEAPEHELLRLTFGLACVDRVKHLIEEPQAVNCLAVLQAYLQGEADGASLQRASEEISRIANGRRGSGPSTDQPIRRYRPPTRRPWHCKGAPWTPQLTRPTQVCTPMAAMPSTTQRLFDDEFTWQVEKFTELLQIPN